jgi:hypothetical protein
MPPYATVINAKEGAVVGTLDLGGGPRQAVSDGKGTVYVIIMNAENGNIITTLPRGVGVDTMAFNPNTMEAISAENNGSMTFIKEGSPTSFSVEQTLQTMPGAKTLALDTKTNHVFTMTAVFAPAVPNAPPGPAGRPMVPGSFSILMVGE